MTKIIKASEADFDKIWPVFQDTVKSGRTYVYAPDISYETAKNIWFAENFSTHITLDENNELLGAYVIRPNHRDLGSHIANAAYIVARAHRGEGIGKEMGKHSFEEAKKLGYKALQFNYVISTNEAAIKLWNSLGFQIIGTVPNAHQHPELGLVDIHIMHREL